MDLYIYRAPKKRANIGLVPRVLAKQGGDGGRGGGKVGAAEGGGGEGGGGGGGGEEMEGIDTAPEKSTQKMSNDDFRNLFKK